MPRGCGRAALLLAALLIVVLPGHSAWAAKWVELRVVRDDARVELLDGGKARVEHRLELLVSGGPLPSLLIRGVDRDAAVEADAQISRKEDAKRGDRSAVSGVSIARVDVPAAASDADDSGSAATAARADLRVTFDDDGGLRRGAYVLLLRYGTDLRAQGAIRGDGPTRIVTWKGPTWDDGLDTTRVTFVVPPAPTAPSAVDPGAQGDVDAAPTFLATATRTRETDELVLVKPYAPKGEPVTWMVRVDARALGEAAHDSRRVSAVVGKPAAAAWGTSAYWDKLAEQAWSSRTAPWMAGSLVFLGWALIVGAKSREASRTHAAARARARPLLPLPLLVRAPASAAALVAGLWLQIAMPTPTRGALVLVVSALLAAHRSPAFKPSPRGPGTWLVVAAAEAFARPPRPTGARLDSSSRAGRVLFASLILLGLGCAAFLVSRGSIDRGVIVALDLTVLFPIFLTGRIADLPPDAATAPAALLRRIAQRVGRLGGPGGALRVVPRIRVPKGGVDPDDLRLALSPARPLAGFRGLAIGASFGQGAFGWVALPEILVRVQVGSPADRALGPVARRARVMEGAREGERVLSFVPRLPTASVTATLAVAILSRVIATDAAPQPPAPTPLPPGTRPREEGQPAPRAPRVRIAA